MEIIGPRLKVPANSSRLFEGYSEALNQQPGIIQLGYEDSDPLLFNSEYDSNLIKYDSQYCTSINTYKGKNKTETLKYFSTLMKFLPANPTIIEIGCGKGEFISELQTAGIQAIGFDPVAPPNTYNLFSRYWHPTDLAGDLYVMRCVLPHIQDPWEFLNKISQSSPSSLVLIEFQRIEWVIDNYIWYQINHDHVNLFSIHDFKCRYNVVESGTHSNEEWGWALIQPSTFKLPPQVKLSDFIREKLGVLFQKRQKAINLVRSLNRPIAIYGGAAKGSILAHAFSSVTEHLFIIDSDPNKWNRYLELTKCKVFSPENAIKFMTFETLVLVANPNHLDVVKHILPKRCNIVAANVLDSLNTF